MRTPILLLLFVLLLLSLIFCCSGDFSLNTYLSPSQLPNQPLSMKDFSIERARSILMSLPFASKRSKTWVVKPSLGTLAPARSPIHLGPSSSPSPRRGHHRHRHVRVEPHDVAPAPSKDPGCDQICVEPLTASPFGSPCGCVFPMKVKLLLDIAPYAIFPVMSELEIEIAEGTYLTQSQVKIMGASADSQNQGRTVVDINLVPLGERFDNTTAILTYDRFQHKKVPLNLTLFGNYEVVYISYPGIPSSPPYEIYEGHGPAGSAGGLPITADFGGKNQRMNIKTIMIIALSAFVLLVVLLGAIWVFVQWRRFGRPSSAVGPAFTSSIHKRSAGMGSILSSSIASSTSVSLMSTMATSILSVKTFPLAELEKATNKFSSQRVLGEGGFGRVYHGIMEDGTEVAVKVLTRDNLNQNGDREFIAEVEMLSRLHHRNLVKLIGICIEGRTRSLVYEIVRNGSVESHLHGVDKVNGPLDWEARMKIALGAARGLAYLHEDSNPRVIHRDFKASNVLLEADFTPKVSDFGLAREATEGSHHISTRVMGTFGYVAPEYAMTGHLLVKSDVYSYGVVLLELLSGRKPVDMSHSPGQENLVTWARPLLTSREGLQQLVDPTLAGTYDFDDMAKVAAIASMCVHPEVTHRPFMGEVVQALKLIYNDNDETGGDCYSQKESSVQDSDFKGDLAPSESSWWNAGGLTPRMNYGHASSCPKERRGHRERLKDQNAREEEREDGVRRKGRKGREAPLSARKLAAGLWRLQLPETGSSVPGRNGKLGFQPDVGHIGVPFLRNRNSKGYASEANDLLQSPRSTSRNGFLSKLSNSVMEGQTKWDPICLKTSDEIRQIYSQMKLLDQQVSAVSVVSVLEAELEQARARIQELEMERCSSKKKLEHFLRNVSEERVSWRSREHEKVRAFIDDIKSELNRERKCRQRTDILNSKLVNELADVKLSAKRYMQEYEKERKARELIEEVCDELAKEIGEDKAEVEALKRESMKLREEVDEERKMLQMAEVWREERVQMKLVDAKVAVEEKYSRMNKIVADLENFLTSRSATPDVKEMREVEYLRQAAAAVNIQDIKDFFYEPPNPDDIFSVFEEVNFGEPNEREIEQCVAYSPASHGSKIRTVSPEGNGIIKDRIQRHPVAFVGHNGDIEEDESGWETVSHLEDQGSSYSPDGSAPSVNKNRRESNVSESGTEWEEEVEGTPITEISEVCSVPTKQTKKVSSIARLWRSGQNNGENYKIISLEGIHGRLSNGRISTRGLVSPDRGSGKGGLSPSDLVGQWNSPETGHHIRGMKGCIPLGAQKHSLKAKLLEARLDSHKVQLRHVLKQKI